MCYKKQVIPCDNHPGGEAGVPGIADEPDTESNRRHPGLPGEAETEPSRRHPGLPKED